MKIANTIKRGLVLGLFFYLPIQGMAWGLLGHRIVGEIANSYLTKKTKRAIAGILGNESVAMSSNWADFIKSDPGYNYLSNWHYINLKAGLSQNEVVSFLEADTSTNAYTKISFLSNQLKNRNLPMADKILYLKVLIHLVADIHQPLHVGRPEDLGGNKIRVLWFNDPYNLHQVWDEVLIGFQKLSYTEYVSAINFVSKDQRSIWQKEPLSLWFYQSYQLAEKIYNDVKGPEEKLGFQYNYKYKNNLDEQLLKGGVHLAGMLNEIFK